MYIIYNFVVYSEMFALLVARVGFEQESYTLTEMEGAVQRVCVRIYDPPQDEELPFNVFLVYESQTIPNSAG